MLLFRLIMCGLGVFKFRDKAAYFLKLGDKLSLCFILDGVSPELEDILYYRKS
jgi:hypothetical protein